MKIQIFHATAGYGHKKVAQVLEQAFQRRGLKQDEVRIYDALDETPFVFRKTYPASYYYMVKYAPALWGAAYESLDRRGVDRCLRPLRSAFNRFHGAAILKRVQREDPDHLICTHFFTAELFATAKKKGRLRAKLTTVVTDFYPHAFWVNDITDQYWVMNETSRQAMKAWGVNLDTVHAGGIPVDSVCLPTGRKEAILQRFNFSKDRFTLLITSGSFGLGPYIQILKILEKYKDRLQCFVVCGHNQKMRETLEREKFKVPVRIFGFVDFMPDLMEASDLVLAKPGGATTVETLAKGVPMIVLHPIPGQEMRNAHFLKEKKASFFMNEPEEIEGILDMILADPAKLEEAKHNVHIIAKPYAADDLATLILGEKKGNKR